MRRKLVYKCNGLNDIHCNAQFIDYEKDGLTCPKCGGSVTPIREATEEDLITMARKEHTNIENILIFKMNTTMMDGKERKKREHELTVKTGHTCIIIDIKEDVIIVK